ncbi:MAG: hypothetical protein Q7S26_03390 [bacterium]|nr:hypothetical protein [bacterium]
MVERCILNNPLSAGVVIGPLVVLLVALDVYCSHLLVGDGRKMWVLGLVLALLLLLFFRLLLEIAHRLEFPWWYRREHRRVECLGVNLKTNTWEITPRLFSFAEMNRRRGLPLVDPDHTD